MRHIDEHPWVMAAVIGTVWGLAAGALFVLTVRPRSPAVTLGLFALAGLVGFGPAVVYSVRRAERPT